MDKYCGQCGTKVVAGKFCEACGAPLDQAIVTKPVLSDGVSESVLRPAEPRAAQKPSGSRMPLIMGGTVVVLAILAGVWLLYQAKYSPEVVDAFPPETAQPQTEAPLAKEQPPGDLLGIEATYEDFVGNWIINQNGEETVFWIQEVENRYVGADDFSIIEFSEIQRNSLIGVVTDGPESGAKVVVILSSDSNTLQFIIAPAQKPEIRYEGVRNTSLGQGTITTDDITALETMVTAAFEEKETAQGAEQTEKEASLKTAIGELGEALQIYYVEEGKRNLLDAQAHLREFLMMVTYNGFGMSAEYVEEMVEGTLGR